MSSDVDFLCLAVLHETLLGEVRVDLDLVDDGMDLGHLEKAL
jgi:hypothetical protein